MKLNEVIYADDNAKLEYLRNRADILTGLYVRYNHLTNSTLNPIRSFDNEVRFVSVVGKNYSKFEHLVREFANKIQILDDIKKEEDVPFVTDQIKTILSDPEQYISIRSEEILNFFKSQEVYPRQYISIFNLFLTDTALAFRTGGKNINKYLEEFSDKAHEILNNKLLDPKYNVNFSTNYSHYTFDVKMNIPHDEIDNEIWFKSITHLTSRESKLSLLFGQENVGVEYFDDIINAFNLEVEILLKQKHINEELANYVRNDFYMLMLRVSSKKSANRGCDEGEQKELDHILYDVDKYLEKRKNALIAVYRKNLCVDESYLTRLIDYYYLETALVVDDDIERSVHRNIFESELNMAKIRKETKFFKPVVEKPEIEM